MAVPWPKACGILAHELRAPLGVLQGYIRLLERQRPDDDPERPMLQAMLEATGRITTIARQASDLGAWLQTVDEGAPLACVEYAGLFAALADRTSAGHPQIRVQTPSPQMAMRTLRADVDRLSEALLSTAESLRHETGEEIIEIAAPDRHSKGPVTIQLAPPADSTAIPDAGFEAGAERVASFDRSGSGLALIIAAYVLEAHGARVTPGEHRSSLLVRIAGEGDPA